MNAQRRRDALVIIQRAAAHAAVVDSPPRRLVAPGLAPGAIAAALVAAVVTSGLGARYADASRAGRIDSAVDPRLVRWFANYRSYVHIVEASGRPAVVAVLTVALVVTFCVLGRRRGAVLAAVAPPVASMITELVLKPLVERTRSGEFSFPSGHATGIFAVALVIAIVALDRRRPCLSTLASVLMSVFVLGVATAVAAASIAVQDHFATDTLGGACVALASVLLLSVAIDALADRKFRSAQGVG